MQRFRSRCSVLLVASVLAAGCNTPPPRPWLHYEPSGAHGWSAAGGKLVANALGCNLAVDLNRRETRIELTIVDDSGGDVQIKVGPEAVRNPTAAIGELQRRPLDNRRGEEVPDFVPYVSMQSVELRHGWRGTFYLDSPLGREPVLGQYLVLVIEIRDAKGGFERKLLPLVATNAGATSRVTDR